MLITLTCQRCGAEGIRRNYPAKYCWPCSTLWGKSTGASTAAAAVGREIKAGRLPRAVECQCVDCGKQARDYDHRDYNKPLDVVPVCRSCNKLRGPAIPVHQA